MNSAKEFRRRFTKIDGPSARMVAARDIQATIRFDRVQALSQNGFVFTIHVSNRSSEEVAILNPLDYLHVIMEDEEGWPVQLPVATPARALLNPSQPIEITRPYVIEAITNDRSDPDLLDVADKERIILKAQTTYLYKIRINNVQDFDRKTLTRTKKNKPLEKGKYRINLKLTIMQTSEEGNIYDMYESGYVDFELIQ